MTIGVRFPDGPFDPAARVQAAVDAAMTGYRDGLDRRMRDLLDAGIALERISIVSVDSCRQCRGSGVVTSTDQSNPLRLIVTISECPECPGICVDGKPIARFPHRELPPST